MNWRHGLILASPVLTGLLMTAAFAPFEMADTAWCAWVPLILASAYMKPSQAIRLGWLAGMVFWITVMWWLTRVTVVGWLLLCAYISLYFIPPVWVSAWWFRRFGVQKFPLNVAYMVILTCVWVTSEYARLNLFTGFPWNPFGATQYANIAFLQHASWGGVYALGALLMWANAAIAVTIMRYLHKHARLGRKPHPELMLGMAVIVVAFVTGGNMSRKVDLSGREMRIALIQPSIPQDDKWTPEKQDMIYERLRVFTSNAVVRTRPDLVVWPETALPDDVKFSEASYELVYGLARLGTPILVGSMDSEYIADQPSRYFNCSFLFDTNGVIIGTYEKRHLVLLGEYVPFHEHVKFLTAMTPLQASFSPGHTSTVFRLPGKNLPFSSLICFEDSLGYLGRESVRNGARLLINQTNDGWFDPSAASLQHMALCTFRAVENRVPVVRSANTGISCAINARGQVREILTDADGNHHGAGFQLVTVHVPPEDMNPTFYTRFGDVFAFCCLPVGLIAMGLAWRSNRRRSV